MSFRRSAIAPWKAYRHQIRSIIAVDSRVLPLTAIGHQPIRSSAFSSRCVGDANCEVYPFARWCSHQKGRQHCIRQSSGLTLPMSCESLHHSPLSLRFVNTIRGALHRSAGFIGHGSSDQYFPPSECCLWLARSGIGRRPRRNSARRHWIA